MTINPLSTVEPWDLVTDGYTRELIPVFQKWTRDSLEQVPLNRTDSVIDIACGPGTVSLLVAPIVNQVMALDFSEEMINALRKQIDGSGITNIHAQVCDCQALPFEDEQFDAAFSQFGLMFFPDRMKGFAEAYRVLKPGGRISVSSWAPVAQSEAMTTMLEALEAGFKQYLPSAKDNRNIVKGLDDPDTFIDELQQSGFENVAIREVAHSFAADTPARFWKRMAASSAPITLMRSRISETEWREGEDRAIKCVADKLAGKEKLYSTAYLACASKPKNG